MQALPAFLQQIAIGAVLLCAVLIGPSIAFGLIHLRRRRERAIKRAPITRDLLRGPGHTLRSQIEEIHSDLDMDLMALTWVPLFLITYLLASEVFNVATIKTAFGHAMFVVASAIGMAFLIRRVWHRGIELDRLRTGYDAEVAVGQELDQLMRQGAVVFHDLPAEGFNIDHVVVAVQGVFAVETKGFSKPIREQGKVEATVVFDGHTLAFPTWTTREPIEQAERQAAWLSRWLASAVGQPVPVLPVLALPGWFVERKGRAAVRVFNGRELSRLLGARGSQPLSDQDVQRIVHQVEQRCRTVEPTRRRDPASTRPKTTQ